MTPNRKKVTTHWPEADLERIDELAADIGLSRSDTVRLLALAALRALVEGDSAPEALLRLLRGAMTRPEPDDEKTN